MGHAHYRYDAWGRLTSATVGSTSIAYSYDALSRTLSRAVSGGSTTTYTYSGTGQSPTSQTIDSGSPTYYAWGAAGPLAQKSGSATRFYTTDPHGDLAAVFDTSGVATGTLSYDPWGTPTAVGSDATGSLLGYQSQPTDPTTGLVDMGARLYDPSQARFTTQDTLLGSPTNPLTLNQYIYAGDSPLDNSDPTGNSFACAGQQCDAAQTVKYHAIQGMEAARNNNDPAQAAAYRTQWEVWTEQAPSIPVSPPRAAPPSIRRPDRPGETIGLQFYHDEQPGGGVDISVDVDASLTIGSEDFSLGVFRETDGGAQGVVNTEAGSILTQLNEPAGSGASMNGPSSVKPWAGGGFAGTIRTWWSYGQVDGRNVSTISQEITARSVKYPPVSLTVGANAGFSIKPPYAPPPYFVVPFTLRRGDLPELAGPPDPVLGYSH